MKTRYKVLILLLIIVISAIFYHLYVRKQYLTLNPEDRGIIVQSFGKDSDGKGYSDEGHRMMIEDVNKLTSLSQQEKDNLTKFYKSLMINKRKFALSSNKEEFLINEKFYNENLECWTVAVVRAKMPKVKLNFFINGGSPGETTDLNEYLDVLTQKYHRSVSNKDLKDIINPSITDEGCKKFL